MPYTAAGSHPFDAARGKNSLYTGGLLILDSAFMKNRERGDSRMGMPAKVGPSSEAQWRGSRRMFAIPRSCRQRHNIRTRSQQGNGDAVVDDAVTGIDMKELHDG
jgi:hypothetical protein